MPAPSNGSFETPGATPGSALGWTATFTSTASGYGAYAYNAALDRRRAETYAGGWPRQGAFQGAFTSNGTAVLSAPGHTLRDGTVAGQFATTVVLLGTPPSPLTSNVKALEFGTAASRESAPGPFALTNGQPITLALNKGVSQTKVFATGEFADITNATPAEVASALTAFFASKMISASATVTNVNRVTIASGISGTDSAINISVTPAALAFTTGALVGTGNVGNLAAPTAAEEAGLRMSLIYWVVNVVPGVSFGLSAAAQGAPLVVLAGSGTAIEPTNEFMITVLDAVTSRRGLYIDDPWPAPLVDHESFNGWLPLLKTYILSGPNPPANVRTGMLGMTSVATPNGVPIETFAPPAMSSSFSAAGGVNLTVLYGADMPPIGLGITIRTTGALPTPGVAALLYYVIINDPVARTFQVSLALNGAPVNWTAPGTGRHFTSVDGGWGVDQDKYRGLNGTPPRLPGDLVRGLFDGGLSAAETYSAWTPALALYRFSGRLGGDTVRALVNSGLDQAEAFLTVVASVWTAQIIATSALDLLCAVPPSIGAGVVLSVDAGGTLPAPYVVSTTYFCTARGAGSCQLAATRGGAAIAHTTLGSGTLRMAADPVWAWAG